MSICPGIDEVVLTAAGLDGAERERYLHGVAAGAPALAEAARRRLAAARDLTDSFLERPAADRLGGVPAESKGSTSGAALPAEQRYELGEQLGEGGMGRVVKAFDRQLGRTVALKLLTHEDPAILRLFLREARVQARLSHDHVLEVYDCGELRGQPFIAMHYVAGGTLEDVEATLAFEQKVRLLAQAARGLHAAHREGLLHRDVKPSNILVEPMDDGTFRALVTDFGLAKDLADADVTASGDVAGSPQFIAPERLVDRSTNDRRSDVYSLGVTLYRLLARTLPWAGEPTVEVLRRVVHQDMPPPRLVQPSLPKELEAIIMRCTTRDPGQRYASARAVAADLERYLEGEVVEAYAAGLAYRLTRFVLRNKLLAGLAAAAAATLLVTSVAVAMFAVRADSARERAEMRHGQAEKLIRFMVVDLRDKLDSLGRLDVLDDVGDAAGEYFAAVPAQELSEDELLRRSRMLYQIGDVRIRQGDLAGAVAPMEESLALARRLAALKPDDGERLFELGQSHYWVGFVYWEQGDLGATRGPWEAYLEASRRLVDKDPGNLDWRRELSYAHSNLGSLLEAEGDLDGALAQFLAVLVIDQELASADPGNAEARSELAATHNTVGIVLQTLGRLDEAGGHLRAELRIRQALVAADEENRFQQYFLGAANGQLGHHLSMRGDWPAAEEYFRAQREIFTDLVAHDMANTAWRFTLAWSHLMLGRAALVRGDLGAATALWQLSYRLNDELLALDTTPHKWRRTKAVCLYHLALAQKLRGDAAARTTTFGAVEILEELAVARPTDRFVHRWLSQSHLLAGSLESSPSDAGDAFERAAAVIAPFARGQRDGTVLAPWAAALSCLGRSAEARPVVETLAALGYSEPELAGFCKTAEKDRSR